MNAFSQYPAACYGSWPEWQGILDLKYKVQNSKFLPKDKKDKLLNRFEKLKIAHDGFYFGSNDFCKEWEKAVKQTQSYEKYFADMETEKNRSRAAGCEGEVSESQFASCLTWYNKLTELTNQNNKRKEELNDWWTALHNKGYQLLNVEATNNNHAFIKDVKKALKPVTYYDSLVYKYNSPEEVRQKHLPLKSKLKKFLKEFYMKKNGTIIPIKGDSKLHTNRNRYNMAPSKLVIIKKMNDWSEASLDFGYHGGKTEFRGKGSYAGCQAVYNKNGSLDDNTKHMGTFDYAYFYCDGVSIMCFFKHKKWDISPHNENSNYESGLTITF